MATTTENLGLTLTPGSEWATKKYGTFITEMAGQTGSSNLELIDKAVGEDRDAISALEEAVDVIETNIGGVNSNVQEQLDSKADKTTLNNAVRVLNDQITNQIAAIDYPVDSVNGKTGNVNITAYELGATQFAFSGVYGGSDFVGADVAHDQLWFEAGDGITITGEKTETKKAIKISTSTVTSDTSGLMSAADKSKLDYTNVAYGTCPTAAADAAKVITVSGNTNWALTTGSRITVKFSYTNTASNPTFNVNGTGAKSVWYNTGVITTSNLSYAGYTNRPMDFVYDGTQFIFTGWSIDSNTTYTNASLGQGYGTCSTAAATVAKVVTLSNYSLTNGGIVTVKFTNAVPAVATMNVNDNGAKPIYYRGAAIGVGIIDAGDTATFIYNGSQYHLLTVDRNRFFSLLVPYGTPIAANTNLNTIDLLKVGNYYCSSNANAATLTNCPTTTAFMMTVSSPLSTTIDNETTGTWIYRLRTIQTYTGPAYEQYCSANATADSTNGTKGTWTYGPWNKIIKANDLDSATSSIQTQLDGKAASSHNHSADNITSGTLPVARGGTGITSNPSMLTNLGSTTAANVLTASPRPGVTGTLPIANGGTGANNESEARTNLGITVEWLNEVHNHKEKSISPIAVELDPGDGAPHGGYIDFHYGGTKEDFTSRIIEAANGTIHVQSSGDVSYPILHTGNISKSGGLVNTNLLHNGNFLKPINTRGQTEYIGKGYSVDRWRMAYTTDAAYVEDGGLRMVNNLTTGSSTYFRQYFDRGLPAGTYTLSALVTAIEGGTATIYMCTADGLAVHTPIELTVGMNTVTKTVGDGEVVRIQGTIRTGCSVTFAGIKMERGEQQTLAEQDSSGNWVIIEQPNEQDADILRCISSVADATDFSSHDSYWRYTKMSDSEHQITDAEETPFNLMATPTECRGYRIRITNSDSGAVSTTARNAVGTLYLYGGDTRYWLHDINTTSTGNIFIDFEIMYIYDTDGNPTGFTYKGGGCNESDPDLSFMDVWHNGYNKVAEMSALNQLLVKFTKSSTYLSYPFTYRVEVWRID